MVHRRAALSSVCCIAHSVIFDEGQEHRCNVFTTVKNLLRRQVAHRIQEANRTLTSH